MQEPAWCRWHSVQLAAPGRPHASTARRQRHRRPTLGCPQSPDPLPGQRCGPTAPCHGLRDCNYLYRHKIAVAHVQDSLAMRNPAMPFVVQQEVQHWLEDDASAAAAAVAAANMALSEARAKVDKWKGRCRELQQEAAAAESEAAAREASILVCPLHL